MKALFTRSLLAAAGLCASAVAPATASGPSPPVATVAKDAAARTPRADGAIDPSADAGHGRILEHIDAVGRRGFLYEVTRPSLDGRVGKRLFLYGTIHVGRVGGEPFNAPLMQALRQSRRLALEADPSDSASVQRLVVQLGQYADGDSLQRHVTPAVLARALAFGAQNGIAADRIERLRPWLLASMVALRQVASAGLDADLGSEFYLVGYARAVGLPIVETEGLAAQLRLLSAPSDALQSAQLDEAFDDAGGDDATDASEALFDLWLNGDGAGADALVERMHRDAKDKPFERYFVEQLIDARDRTMADRAEDDLERPGATLFAVGSLHLFGERGLIREFERRGYRVTDLQPAADPSSAVP